MLIHRIEHAETFKGPFSSVQFRTEPLFALIEYATEDLVTYPGPQEDSVMSSMDYFKFQSIKEDIKKSNVLFGTKSIKELYSWFHSGILSALVNFNFIYATYETEEDNIILLNRQCIILDKSKCIREVQSINNLL